MRELLLISFLSSQILTQAVWAQGNHVSEPDGCLGKGQLPCAIRAVQTPLDLNFVEGKVRLAAQSSLVISQFDGVRILRLLSGSLLVSEGKALSIRAAQVGLTIEGNCFVSLGQEDQVRLLSLQGQVKVFDQQGGPLEPLPAGFQN